MPGSRLGALSHKTQRRLYLPLHEHRHVDVNVVVQADWRITPGPSAPATARLRHRRETAGPTVPSVSVDGKNSGQEGGLSRQDLVHPRCCFPLQRRQHVTVGIHRQRDLAVTQRLHHDAWMDALSKEKRRAAVT